MGKIICRIVVIFMFAVISSVASAIDFQKMENVPSPSKEFKSQMETEKDKGTTVDINEKGQVTKITKDGKEYRDLNTPYLPQKSNAAPKSKIQNYPIKTNN